MARRRKTSSQILAEMEAEKDALPVRSIGVWTLQKLAILHLYLPAFSSACRGRGYYVDGMAGPGIGRVKEAKPGPLYVWGSPLLALRATPRLQRVILMDDKERNANALRERCRTFGGRATVRKGDVNDDLVPLVRAEVPPLAPCFCFLDPEGTELRWTTIEGLAHLPRPKRKPELMILFPLDMALVRLLPVSRPIRDEDRKAVAKMFANSTWWDIYQARLNGEIDPSAAKASYLDQYRKDLKSLGYQQVISRPVTAPRPAGARSREMYHLFFATDHVVGDEIMQAVFDRPLSLNVPVSQQPPLFE